jgi:DNA adenine methylase
MANPIIPWIGGKRRLADVLIPQFPAHECYVEVFAGGAALYFLRPPAKVEVINDINGELVNLYRVVKNHLEEFVRQFKYALSSRDVFKWRTATTAPPINLLRIEENLSAAHLRLASAYIESLDWKKCMERYDRSHTFFYLDPPYWETEGYGVAFGLEQYELMAEMLRNLKGKAIVSLNDHPDIRRIFGGFHIETTDIKYSVGGGAKTVDRKEVIIYSWDKLADPAGLF